MHIHVHTILRTHFVVIIKVIDARLVQYRFYIYCVHNAKSDSQNKRTATILPIRIRRQVLQRKQIHGYSFAKFLPQ